MHLILLFFVNDISKTIQGRNFIFGLHVDNGKLLYRGIENEPSPTCSSLYMFFLYISSKISPQLYSTESSYFIYRLTMTSCIME